MARPNWKKLGKWFSAKALPVLARVFEYLMWRRGKK